MISFTDEDADNISQFMNGIFTTDLADQGKYSKTKKSFKKEFQPTPKFWTNDEYSKKTKVRWEDKYDEMMEKHFRLEIIEKRIKKSQIPNCIRTEMVSNVEDKIQKTGIIEFTNDEQKHLDTYSLEEENKIKPAFWCSRVYDDKLEVLNKEESKILETDIKKGADSQTEFSKKHGYKEKEKRFHVTFSLLDYMTDGEDELTEWSEIE